MKMNGFADVSVMEMEMVDGGIVLKGSDGKTYNTSSSTPTATSSNGSSTVNAVVNTVIIATAGAVSGAVGNVVKSMGEGKIKSPADVGRAAVVGAFAGGAGALGGSAVIQTASQIGPLI